VPVGVYALGVAAEEFVSEEVSRILADIGPSGAVVTSAPDSPASDGLAEMRILGVLAAGARARLHAADLRVPLWMWHYAWMHAAHCYSKLATQRIEKKRGDEVMYLYLPHEMLFGVKPDLSHVVAFGSRCRERERGCTEERDVEARWRRTQREESVLGGRSILM